MVSLIISTAAKNLFNRKRRKKLQETLQVDAKLVFGMGFDVVTNMLSCNCQDSQIIPCGYHCRSTFLVQWVYLSERYLSTRKSKCGLLSRTSVLLPVCLIVPQAASLLWMQYFAHRLSCTVLLLVSLLGSSPISIALFTHNNTGNILLSLSLWLHDHQVHYNNLHSEQGHIYRSCLKMYEMI